MTINPSGLINGKYNYLFYETEQIPQFVTQEGWIVHKDSLEFFFQSNLKKSGFNNFEIEDFISFWIPKMTSSEFYAIYPQYNEQVDQLIKLNFSIIPDTIIRLFYFVEECNSNDIQLKEPEIPNYNNKGFIVREWGVIRRFQDHSQKYCHILEK